MKTIKLLFVTMFTCIFSLAVHAQVPAPLWSECLGGDSIDYSSSICHVSNQKVLMCGFTKSSLPGPATHFDALVIKKDENGNTLFTKTYGGVQDDYFNKGIELPTGEFLFIGSTTSSNLPGFHAMHDILIVKTDSLGNTIWTKCYGGTGIDIARDIVYSNNTYTLVGETESNGGDFSGMHNAPLTSYFDMFILKLDTSGTVLASKCIGGSQDDRASSVVLLPDNTVAIIGRTSSPNDGDVLDNHSVTGSHDIFVCRVTANLNILWSRCIGSTFTEVGTSGLIKDDYLFVSGFGKSFVDGDITQVVGEYDIILSKIDTADGTPIFVKCYGTLGNESNTSLKETSSGNLLLGNITEYPAYSGQPDAFVISINTSGAIQWNITFGGPSHDEFTDILPLDMDNFMIFGSTTLQSGYPGYIGGGRDLLLIGSYVPFQPFAPLPTETQFVAVEKSDISVSPNPSTGMMRVSIPYGDTSPEAIVSFFDLSGKIVLSEKTSETMYVTDITHFPKGLYVLCVQSGTQTFYKKVQKM